MNEHFVVLFRKVFVQLSLWDPGIITMGCFRRQLVREFAQTTVVMRAEEVGSDTGQTVALLVFFLGLSELSYCVDQGHASKKFNFPLVIGILNKEVLPRTHESRPKQN